MMATMTPDPKLRALFGLLLEVGYLLDDLEESRKEDGVLETEFARARRLNAVDPRHARRIRAVVEALRTCHRELPVLVRTLEATVVAGMRKERPRVQRLLAGKLSARRRAVLVEWEEDLDTWLHDEDMLAKRRAAAQP